MPRAGLHSMRLALLGKGRRVEGGLVHVVRILVIELVVTITLHQLCSVHLLGCGLALHHDI